MNFKLVDPDSYKRWPVDKNRRKGNVRKKTQLSRSIKLIGCNTESVFPTVLNDCIRISRKTVPSVETFCREANSKKSLSTWPDSDFQSLKLTVWNVDTATGFQTGNPSLSDFRQCLGTSESSNDRLLTLQCLLFSIDTASAPNSQPDSELINSKN